MARFVVAGKADCPLFARTEALARKLNLNLPDFKIRIVPVLPIEWPGWLEKEPVSKGVTCRAGETHIVWRELGEGSAKGTRIGGLTEFSKLLKEWYGVEEDETPDLANIVAENIHTLQVQDEEGSSQNNKVLDVRIWGACSSIIYQALPSIVGGAVFGENQRISVQLGDTNDQSDNIRGVAMELWDCAFEQLSSVGTTSDVDVLFEGDVDVVIIVLPPVTDDQAPAAYFSSVTPLIKSLGAALSAITNKSEVSVVVTGSNPSITYTVTSSLLTFCSIPQNQITCVSLEEVNKAKNVYASTINEYVDDWELKVRGHDVDNIAVWGLDVWDFSATTVRGIGGIVGDVTDTPVSMLDKSKRPKQPTEEESAKNPRVGGPVAQSKALCDHLHALCSGTSQGKFCCMAVYQPDLQIFSSCPVVVREGRKWSLSEQPSKPTIDKINKEEQKLVGLRGIAMAASARPSTR